MATTILGIDLGSYAVKVARLDQGFRTLSLVHIDEARVPPPTLPESDEASGGGLQSGTDSGNDSGDDVGAAPEPEPLRQRQLRALRQLLSAQRLRSESTAVGLSHGVTLRLIDMPLSDPKKVQAALPFELAGQLMSDLDDQIVDQTPAQLAEVRPGGDASSLWLAASADKGAVRDVIEALSRAQHEPRQVGATALATAAVLAARSLPQPNSLAPPEWPVWVLDLGHQSTHIVAVTPQPGRPGQVLTQFARTIARGGEQLTLAVARAVDVDIERATELKHQIGLVGSGDARVKTALRDALKPLLRDLRQTLAAYTSRYGAPPQVLFLCGGTSHMHGIEEFLQGELGISTQALLPPPGSPWLRQGARELAAISMSGVSGVSGGPDDATRTHVSHAQLVRLWPTGCAAVGLALALAGVGPQLNFRKGELAYRSDLAFLREKAPLFAGFAAAILLCVAGWAWATLKVLDREHERLRQQLSSESMTLFGKEFQDGHQVSAELNAAIGADKGDKSVPRFSALDLLEDISKNAPDKNAAGPARLDVVDLSIRAKKIDLKATCGSAQYVDDFADMLKKLPCIKGVQKGKVLTVRNNGPDGKPVEVKQFSLEIETTCL